MPLITGPRVRNQLKNCGVLSSGGALNNVMSGLVSSALELNLEAAHVQHLREEYRSRIRAVRDVFQKHLPEGFECRYQTAV